MKNIILFLLIIIVACKSKKEDDVQAEFNPCDLKSPKAIVYINDVEYLVSGNDSSKLYTLYIPDTTYALKVLRSDDMIKYVNPETQEGYGTSFMPCNYTNTLKDGMKVKISAVVNMEEAVLNKIETDLVDLNKEGTKGIVCYNGSPYITITKLEILR